MQYIAVSVLLLFAATFLIVWWSAGRDRHVLLLSGAFCAYAVATLAQVAVLLPDLAHNAMVAAALYAAGVLLLHQSIVVRAQRPAPLAGHTAAFAALVGTVWYFQYVEQDLLLRVVALNAGLAGLFLRTAWHGRFLLCGSGRDRTLFWLLVALTLHYVPRLVLTAGSLADVPHDSLTHFMDTEFWHWAQFSLAVSGAAAGLALLAVTAADVIAGIERERDRDPLTKLLNRRGLEARLARRRAGCEAGRLAVLVCDLDHFKDINDTYGHLAGDGVLAAVAETIRTTIPEGATPGRIGGEEFVVLLEEVTAEEAFAAAEQLRLAIGGLRLLGPAPEAPVTCSLGVAVLEPGEDLWAAFDRADRLLYAAKQAGRNRTFADWLQCPAA